MNRQDIEVILNNFPGLVVIDEAYINFSRHRSFIQELADYPNLVVLQTLSKAWGLAGLRLGMAFASEAVIEVYNKVKPPYNIGQATQELVLIRVLVGSRERLSLELSALPVVQKVYPSDANFLLVKTTDARGLYGWLLAEGIVVRDRSKVELCEGCLRITVGTEEENAALVSAMGRFVG
jgi:histidinol-phosphate aminotransferase